MRSQIIKIAYAMIVYEQNKKLAAWGIEGRVPFSRNLWMLPRRIDNPQDKMTQTAANEKCGS
jgi:hypothetical protein